MTTPPIGVFARVFPVGTADSVAADVIGAGYGMAQLNLSALGLETMPSDWSSVDTSGIRASFAAAGVELWGLSCSYNMAHPDPRIRAAGTALALESIGHASELGVTAVTLCTGSRNPEKMWSWHPDNQLPESWSDMRHELDSLLAAASNAGVILAVEPEPGNIVSDADAAARLLSELGPDAALVGIIADSANLLAAVPADQHVAVLERSFDMLADHIRCLHAKDLVPWARTLEGGGVVPYEVVAALYHSLPTRPPVIVQDVLSADAARARAYVARTFAPVESQ